MRKQSSNDRLRDRFAGCLLAGAVGDALGAGIEFDSWHAIRAAHGESGVTGYVPAFGRRGAITDDTQMTLFTAEGLVMAQAHGCVDRDDVTATVHRAYRRWLLTQQMPFADRPDEEGRLIRIPGLWSPRAPGNTCLSALRSGQIGTVVEPINDSKGCGGVMRVAPVGFLPTAHERFRLGCDVAAITHGHPDGYLPAVVLAVVVGALVDGADLADALDAAEAQLEAAPAHEHTLAAVRSGRKAGSGGIPEPAQLEALGGGWVGEEALAIALACAVGGLGRPAAALLAAVNHSGDSDSTGAITGNILGAAWGTGWIPSPWLDELELRAEVEEVADDCVRVLRRSPATDQNREAAADRRRHSRRGPGEAGKGRRTAPPVRLSMTSSVDLGGTTTAELVALAVAAERELGRRGLGTGFSGSLGRYAGVLLARALGGHVASSGPRGADVITMEGEHVRVRAHPAGSVWRFSRDAFVSLFTADVAQAVHVILDAGDMRVLRAVRVTREQLGDGDPAPPRGIDGQDITSWLDESARTLETVHDQELDDSEAGLRHLTEHERERMYAIDRIWFDGGTWIDDVHRLKIYPYRQ